MKKTLLIIGLTIFTFTTVNAQERIQLGVVGGINFSNMTSNNFSDKGVDAVILDLRNHGGGALIEANKIVGLFVASVTKQSQFKMTYRMILPDDLADTKLHEPSRIGVIFKDSCASNRINYHLIGKGHTSP